MTPPFEPPSAFPQTALADLDGVERRLAALWSEGPAVILLGHRDCPTTRLTLPFVGRMHQRRPSGAAVAAILQDDPDSARELAGEFDLALPLLVEADPYPLAGELELRTVPTVFLVGTDGRIRRSIEGFHRAELEEMAGELGMAGPLFTSGDEVPAHRPG